MQAAEATAEPRDALRRIGNGFDPVFAMDGQNKIGLAHIHADRSGFAYHFHAALMRAFP